MTERKELEDILGHIHKTMLNDMLEDLRNPEKRTPQLYNAVIKELERNGIDCVPKAGDEAGDTLKKIMENVKENVGDEIEFARIS